MSQLIIPFSLNLVLGPTIWLLISWEFDSSNSRKSRILIHFLPFLISMICFYPDYLLYTSFNSFYMHVLVLNYNLLYYIFSFLLLTRVLFNQSSIHAQNKMIFGAIFGILVGLFLIFDLIHLTLITVEESTIKSIGLFQKIGLILILLTIVFKEKANLYVSEKFNEAGLKLEKEVITFNDILPQHKSPNADARLLSFWENECSMYLAKEFTLERLSKHLKIERTILVRLLHDTYQQNFNEILNRYRIYHFVLKSKADTQKKVRLKRLFKIVAIQIDLLFIWHLKK